MKEKHVKLKLSSQAQQRELSEEALLTIPRCHPDSSVLSRVCAQSSNARQQKPVTYTALGWRMADRIQQAQLLPGDALDIAFTLDQNDHPDFGGLELSLRDFKSRQQAAKA